MRKRLIIFLSILALFFAYLGLRLTPGLASGRDLALGWTGLSVLAALVFSYPLTWVFRRRGIKPPAFYNWLVLLDMGYLSFLLTLVFVRDLFFFPLHWVAPDVAARVFAPEGSLALVVVALVCLLYGVWRATSGPRLRPIDVPIAGLPPELDGFTIAQITDLHVGTTIHAPYVERVVRLIESVRPHAVALTGDIADGDVDELQADVAPMKALAPFQPFYITGNHEYYWNGPRWIETFQSLGLTTLLNSHRVIRHQGKDVLIAGIVDPAALHTGSVVGPDLKAALGPAPAKAAFKILLAHQPGVAHEAEALGFDLQISGHTHGGQFFPWTLVVGRVHEFALGLKRCGRMWVYVGPGTGSWGPPVRFGTRTEIAVLKLRAQDA